MEGPRVSLTFFATVPKSLEDLLYDELIAFGAKEIQRTVAGASFTGSLETAYRVCLWSRFANRVLLPLQTFRATTRDELYDKALALPWPEHFTPQQTFVVDCVTVRSALNHSQFAALVLKDAIVDRFRASKGSRPSVDKLQPDITINLHIENDVVTVALDLSGVSLHRRGYRKESGEAALKENLAAAMLVRAHWPEIAAAQGALVDPLCGSGTLLIEAAMMACDVAPALLRSRFGFSAWSGHQQQVWEKVRGEALERKKSGLQNLPQILGYDHDAKALAKAAHNLARAGFTDRIRLEQREITAANPPPELVPGLLITNPPYGERLGQATDLHELYQQLGTACKTYYQGWRVAILTYHLAHAGSMDLRAFKRHTLYNGALQCHLLHYRIRTEQERQEALAAPKPTPSGPQKPKPMLSSPEAEMFANRLRKNLRRLNSWAKAQQVTCYRVYDADLPEFALAIDYYEQTWIHVQEYAAPSSIAPEKAAARVQAALDVIPSVLSVPPQNVFLKRRQRQRGPAQYQKFATRDRYFEVHEGPLAFFVNFTDYLDTGLFLDHRLTRSLIGSLTKGKTFLNLFSYTGTATVYAAHAGAVASLSIDSSKSYTEWARKNFRRNRVDETKHKLLQEDCLAWLNSCNDRFEVIFIDPPTFSNSKMRTDVLDVQRDQLFLIDSVMNHLTPEGVCLFTVNSRKFKLDDALQSRYQVTDLTAQTIPKDFERNQKIHRCFKIEPSLGS